MKARHKWLTKPLAFTPGHVKPHAPHGIFMATQQWLHGHVKGVVVVIVVIVVVVVVVIVVIVVVVVVVVLL
jgi:hypothetical protein